MKLSDIFNPGEWITIAVIREKLRKYYGCPINIRSINLEKGFVKLYILENDYNG